MHCILASELELLDRLCVDPEDARPAPATILVAAHPDDEVIGAAGRFRRLSPNLAFVHVTDGSPAKLDDAKAAGFDTRRAYADARRRELECALSIAGLGTRSCFELGIVDQEAVFNLIDITLRLAALLHARAPEAVLTHPYEGGHPDHDAVAFAVHCACRLLRLRHAAPQIVEFACYHAGNGGAIDVLGFLPNGTRPETSIVLSGTDAALKREMIRCHRSQARVLEAFPLGVERFRPAPAYDFTQPPHAGRLYYEHFDWGVTGATWRSLASSALLALDLKMEEAAHVA